FRVDDLVDGLDFEEVVARPEAAELATTSGHGLVADRRRVASCRGAPLLAPLEVLLPAVTRLDCGGCTLRQDSGHERRRSDRAGSRAAGDSGVEVGHDGFPVALELLHRQVGCE